jgi:uncharacterized membrane protein
MEPAPNTAPEPHHNHESGAGGHLQGTVKVWSAIRGRILAGILLILPILITFWAIYSLYSALEKYVIGPLGQLILWKARWVQEDAALPYWFETYAAPLLALVSALLLVYGLGFLAHSRLRRAIEWFLSRLPVVSLVYNAVGNVFQALERQRGQERPQRVVLVPFPHPGTRTLAFVTSTCRDEETGKIILCVYVPTTPVPTSGYFLLVPEEEATELSWTSEQGFQTIISGGLTAPPVVRYFQTRDTPESKPVSAAVASAHPANGREEGGASPG